jgi:hypothetical protein
MATPFGRSMRPMIDQMFSGQGQSIPSASAAVTPVTHPHSKLNLPALFRLSQKLAPINYSILPAPAALVLRIEGSFDRAAMTSDRHSAVTKSKQVLLKQVIPYLMNGSSGTFPIDFIENWIKATREGFAILPIGEVFPIVDLFRIAFSKDAVRLETAVGYVIDGSPDSLLRTILLLCEGEETPRGLLLTVLRFTSNALASPLLASLLLTPGSDRTSLTLLVVKSLLHEDPLVRATGSGLVFGVVGRLYDSGENRGGMRGRSATDEEEEEWEVEIASAVLEALEREDASVEVGTSSFIFVRGIPSNELIDFQRLYVSLHSSSIGRNIGTSPLLLTASRTSRCSTGRLGCSNGSEIETGGSEGEQGGHSDCERTWSTFSLIFISVISFFRSVPHSGKGEVQVRSPPFYSLYAHSLRRLSLTHSEYIVEMFIFSFREAVVHS